MTAYIFFVFYLATPNNVFRHKNIYSIGETLRVFVLMS